MSEKRKMELSFTAAAIMLVGLAFAIGWALAIGDKREWRNPPSAMIVSWDLGQQRSTGIIGDDDNDGRLDHRERRDHLNGYGGGHPHDRDGATSVGGPRADDKRGSDRDHG
jgi:hypothetical protein